MSLLHRLIPPWSLLFLFSSVHSAGVGAAVLFRFSEFLRQSESSGRSDTEERWRGGGAGEESGGGGGRSALNVVQRQTRVDSCVNALSLPELHIPTFTLQAGCGGASWC